MICPVCKAQNSKEQAYLGRMGLKEHFRCRYCGMMWNHTVTKKARKKLGIY